MSTRAEQIALTKELNKHILKANGFFKESQKDKAVDTDTIQVNESTVMPPRGKNPQRYPLPVYTSEDTKKEYKNHTYVTHPVLITVENEALTSFNKRKNEAAKHGDGVLEDFAETIIYEWAPTLAAQQFRTTGGNTGAIITGMTGTRKAIVKSDILACHRILDNNGVPKNGRVGLCDTLHFYELLAVTGLTEFQLTGLVDPWIEGDLPRRLGLSRLYVRDGATFYDNTATPVKQELVSEDAKGDTISKQSYVAASNMAMTIWHKNYVRHSLGMSRMEVTAGGAPYNGGTLLNSTLRGGGMISRIDEKGIVALIQQP